MSLLWASAVILLFYHLRWGLDILDPTNVQWLIGNDYYANGYFSFNFFRHQPWTFPLGYVDGFFYPLGTNVYTFDIPMLALFLKPFSAILTDNFQYIGIWFLLCHFLQACFGFMLCNRFAIKGLARIVLITFLLLAPMLMSQLHQPQYFSQWIILAGFWVYFMDIRKEPIRKILLYQLVVVLIGTLMTPMLTAVVFGLSIAVIFRLWISEGVIGTRLAVVSVSVYCGVIISLWMLTGLISISENPIGSWTPTESFVALQNPRTFPSALIPSFPVWISYYLGKMSYPGAGIVLLTILSVFSFGLGKLKRRSGTAFFAVLGIPVLPLLIIVLVFSIHGIVNSSLISSKFFGPSEYFIWPAAYLVFFFVFYVVNSMPWGTLIKNTLFVGCLIIQFYDIQVLFKPEIEYREFYDPLMNHAAWKALFSTKQTVLFFPGFRENYQAIGDHRYFTYCASMYGSRINVGTPARFDPATAPARIRKVNNQVNEGRLDDHTIYVVLPPYLNQFAVAIYEGVAWRNRSN